MSGDDLDDWYDDTIPEGMIWCDRCQGMGIANCYCGGDQCYCLNYGEMECPRCGGEGYHRAPTPEEIKRAVELRALMVQSFANPPADTKGMKDGPGA